MKKEHGSSHYGLLAIMAGLSFLSMYVLMYAMVNAFANVFPNFNQFYMAGLMTAPMLIIEISLMGAMYHNKTWNALIIAGSAAALIGFFILIQQQTAISDVQFLKSMIPHHGGALLMCGRAPIHDAEIVALCKNIMVGQQAEIDQMKAILNRLPK